MFGVGQQLGVLDKAREASCRAWGGKQLADDFPQGPAIVVIAAKCGLCPGVLECGLARRSAHPLIAIEFILRFPAPQQCGEPVGEFERVLQAHVQRRASCIEDVRGIPGEEHPADPVGVGQATVADRAAHRGGLSEWQIGTEHTAQARTQSLRRRDFLWLGLRSRLVRADHVEVVGRTRVKGVRWSDREAATRQPVWSHCCYPADTWNVKALACATDPTRRYGDPGDARDLVAGKTGKFDAGALAHHASGTVAPDEVTRLHSAGGVTDEDLDFNPSCGLQEVDEFMTPAQLRAILQRSALEQLLEASLRYWQDVQGIPRPEAKPERERAELKAHRPDGLELGAGENPPLRQLDRDAPHNPVALGTNVRHQGPLEHSDADPACGEFACEQQTCRARTDDGDVEVCGLDWCVHACQSGLTDGGCQARLTRMEPWELHGQLRVTDPTTGLRAVGALHRLAEHVEAMHVAEARRAGWSWEQIGDALGVSRQSVHAKYGKKEKDV